MSAEPISPVTAAIDSSRTVDGESSADLAHAAVGDPAQPDCQRSDRDTLDRVEIQGGSPGDRVFAWLKHNLAGNTANGRCARTDQGLTAPGRDRRGFGSPMRTPVVATADSFRALSAP